MMEEKGGNLTNYYPKTQTKVEKRRKIEENTWLTLA